MLIYLRIWKHKFFCHEQSSGRAIRLPTAEVSQIACITPQSRREFRVEAGMVTPGMLARQFAEVSNPNPSITRYPPGVTSRRRPVKRWQSWRPCCRTSVLKLHFRITTRRGGKEGSALWTNLLGDMPGPEMSHHKRYTAWHWAPIDQAGRHCCCCAQSQRPVHHPAE
jgi:hypothetical protein